jgi:1-deoxy-D-xylulose 5-phosphate reductoisomerase
VTGLGEAAYFHVMTFKGTTFQTLQFREHHKITTLTLTTTTGPFSTDKMTRLGKLFAAKT